jgi:hypothetical protein
MVKKSKTIFTFTIVYRFLMKMTEETQIKNSSIPKNSWATT